MKAQLIIFLILVSIQSLSAQVSIAEAANSMRNEDRLCKVCIFLEYLVEKNNVEIEEARNEILFEIIQGNEIDCLLQKSKSDSLLQIQIYRELSTPINDCIDLDNCKFRLQKHENRFSFVKQWIEAINIAIRKRE